MRRLYLLLLASGVLLAAAPPGATASQLLVGVGRADITPITGGYKGGWACECARALGQHTRLFARAIVLEQDGRKVALVAEDLSFLPAGMVRDAAAQLASRGFSEQNIIDSASHTHGSPTGFMNFGAYNSVLPKAGNLTDFNMTTPAADPFMYSFMVRQLATAISRADDNLAPGEVGWGQTDLLGVTQNRSLEAHLADSGIIEAPGTGNVNQDPGGYAGTVDPAVDVLRVDKLIAATSSRRCPKTGRTRCAAARLVPVGMWSNFANHGTVVKPPFQYFSADHQGAAQRVVEASIRTAGQVPAGQDVVDAYGNSDAGDMTAGIMHSGPADAEWVGRQEASAMLSAWRSAAGAMTANAGLGLRWTRLCLCGQDTPQGPIDTTPVIGQAAAAGSEELRTIFYDVGIAKEGDMLPFDLGPQGDKVQTLREGGSVPQAVPLTVVRIADQLMITVPGEATVGTGRMFRSAVAAATQGARISRIVISGFANEYLSYIATPQEYERQHYEGGFTLYGRTESLVFAGALADLAHRLVTGLPTPDPYPYDPNNGKHTTDGTYGDGAAQGSQTAQPADIARLGHATFAWQGGADGLDRPVDRAFVTISRLARAKSTAACASRRSIVVHLPARGGARVRSIVVSVNGQRARTRSGNHRSVVIDLRGRPRQTVHVRLTVTTALGRYTLHRTFHPCTRRRRTGSHQAHTGSAGPTWQPVTDDLGLQIVWSVDDQGHYRAQWEIPLSTPPGTYRFQITAKRYQLTSQTFRVSPTNALTAALTGGQVTLNYPAAVENTDWTYRPPSADGATLTFTVDGHAQTVRQATGTQFPIPTGAHITIPAGAAQDLYGNTNANALALR
jgi:hypothetical protein